MLQNQNRIELKLNNSPYEEYSLNATETGKVLPGYLVSVFDNGGIAAIRSQAGAGGAADILALEPVIVVENDLLGLTVNHVCRPGDVTRCRRMVSGDTYLVRCEAGSYAVGQPVYLKQSANGVLVTGTGTGVPFGYSLETFVVNATMVDLVDTSTTDLPPVPQIVGGKTYRNLNGVLVNLLRVRVR